MPKVTSFVNTELDTLLETGHLGIFTVLPTALAGTGGTEMTGGTPAYARIALASYMPAAASRAKSNDTIIEINTNDGTAVGLGVWDASANGNLRWYDNILASISLESNTFDTLGEGANYITLAQSDVRDVVVKDNTEVTTYVEGTDYYVQYESGTIYRITGGGISSGDTVKVTYKYPTTQATLSGIKFTIAVGSLSFADKQFK